MCILPARIIRCVVIVASLVGLAVMIGGALGSSVDAATLFSSEDAPAPDEDKDPPAEEPEPTQEPEPSPSPDESTDATTRESSGETSPDEDNEHSSTGDSDDSNSESGAGNDAAGGAAAGATRPSGGEEKVVPSETTGQDRADAEPRRADSSLGWIFLIGALASAGGAIAVYRRDPSVLALPRVGRSG